MAVAQVPYSLDNLPPGFHYNANISQIYSPTAQAYCTLNTDNTVTDPSGIATYESVDLFARVHLFFVTDEFEKLRQKHSKDKNSDSESYIFLSHRFENRSDRDHAIFVFCTVIVFFLVVVPLTVYLCKIL